tara:strand:- start:2608 stop:2922 length:315 start_codon:yes stop_codon:yes gene_type:complete
MPQYNLIGQEINVGDLIFEIYPSTPNGWVSEGVVSRFSEKSVFYKFYDKVNGEIIERERYCKAKYITIVSVYDIVNFINSPNVNEWTKQRAGNLLEQLNLLQND